MDLRGVPLVNEDGNLYYLNDKMSDKKDGIESEYYNVQLFLTDIGIDKYKIKPNTPALRPELGGQPCLFFKISLTIPEKTNKKFTIPFAVQNIKGHLQLASKIPPLEWQAEFIVERDVLATGYLSFGRFYLAAPESKEKLKALRKAHKEKEKERRVYLKRRFKELGGDELSKSEISALQDIRRQWESADSNAAKKLLSKGYIHTKGIFSSKYNLTEDGEDVLNWVLHEYK